MIVIGAMIKEMTNCIWMLDAGYVFINMEQWRMSRKINSDFHKNKYDDKYVCNLDNKIACKIPTHIQFKREDHCPLLYFISIVITFIPFKHENKRTTTIQFKYPIPMSYA